jgi:LysM repeat protein
VAGPNLTGMITSLTRTAAMAVAAVAVLGLTACGGDGNAATVTTISIRPESYALKPPATAPTTAPAIPVADPEGRTQSEQSYTVHEDEFPYEIAQLFDVDLDALRNYNGWSETYAGYPAPGGVVRIPPGAKFLDPNAPTTTAAPGSTEGTTAGDTDTAEAGSCTEGTHTLEANDYPVEVAKKYDVTIEALLAVNGFSMDGAGNVAAWPAAGSTVKIPAAANCTPESTSTTLAG